MSTKKALSIVAVVVLLVPAAFYAWAYASTDESGLARAIVWRDADVSDYRRFPSTTLEASERPLILDHPPSRDIAPLGPAIPGGNVDAFMERTQTAAFIAIRGRELLHERYFNGYDQDSTVTTFSVAKSFVSALVGIAIDDGSLALEDSVTDHVPELLERDERFEHITVRHLLTMSSGLRWSEQGLPWSDDAETYNGSDLRRLAIEDTEVVSPPGERFVYNPYNTLLLGLVLERATRQSVTEFMEERLWKPMGAGARGSWSIDSTETRFEKMESGLNGRAVDLAKLGLVYLRDGIVRGQRILPSEWVAESTAYGNDVDPSTAYQYHWWTYRDTDVGEWFLAQGNKGQFIGVFPSADLVIARFGIDFGYARWPELLADLAAEISGG